MVKNLLLGAIDPSTRTDFRRNKIESFPMSSLAQQVPSARASESLRHAKLRFLYGM